MKPALLYLTLIAQTIVACSASAAMGAADFHATTEHPFGFRGDGTGRFPDATPVTTWSEKPQKNIRWSAIVGAAFSSPILTVKHVYVTAEPNLLICLDRSNGKEIWKTEFKPELIIDEKNRKIAAEYEAPKDGSEMMAATPLTDGKSIYVILANGIVCAVSLDGKIQWTAFIDADQVTGYGRSASPILVGNKLIVHMTNLYAFDPTTGKTLWMNKDAPSTYGTPAAAKVAGVEIIVTPNGDLVRISDGKTLATELGRATHTTPVIENGIAYFGDSPVNAVRLNPAGKNEETWSATITGDVFSSPLIHSGLLLTAGVSGKLFAYDTKGKGEQTPIIDARPLFGEPDGTAPVVYSSITLAGKYIFVASNQGDTVVLEATREAKEVSRNPMSIGTGSTPIFSGSEMYLRSGNKLNCIGAPR